MQEDQEQLKEKKNNKTVYVGWLNYCPRQRKYGSWSKSRSKEIEIVIKHNAVRTQVQSKKYFFQKWIASCMMFYLGYYDNELIEDEDRTLEEYINT